MLASKKSLLELWIVSMISGFYFALTSNGGLCMLLLNSDNFRERILLAAILTIVLWGITVCLYSMFQRVRKTDVLQNVIRELLDTKIAIFFYLLAVFRLTQAVFYPLYAEHPVYYVSHFLFGLYLILLVLSFAIKHEQFRKAITFSTVLCFGGWCISRIIPEIPGMYRIFYYSLLLINLFSVLWITKSVTVFHIIGNIKDWFLRNIKSIMVCLMAAAIGCCIEIVSAFHKDLQIMLPRCVFWAAVCTCITMCTIFYLKKEQFVERAFLTVVLTVGIYLAVFMPLTTGVTWDDQVHYLHTIELSQGKNVSMADRSMAELDETKLNKIATSQKKNKAYYDFLAEESQYPSPQFFIFGDIQAYQKIGYLPNSLGISIGQMLVLPYGLSFLLGRISGVLFYAFIMYSAMKQLISGKLLIAVVALLPTFIFQAANYTYDAWIICLTIYAFSSFISWFQSENTCVKPSSYILVLIALTLAIAPKGVYFPLILLLLLVPSDKFTDKKQYKTFLLSVLGTVLVCFLAYMLLPFLGGKNQGDLRMHAEVSSVGQILYILKNPLAYAKKLFLFLKYYLSIENSYAYTCSMAFINLKPLDYHATLMVLLIVAAFMNRSSMDITYNYGSVKLFSIIILYATAAIIATVMYMVCVPPGGDMGAGCQFRYLAPLVYPFLLLAFNFGPIELKKPQGFQAIILGLSAYVVTMLVWSNVASQYIL